MATSELAIRFTEGKYATRLEVSRDLKMSLIDNIWNSILSYRSNFNRYLTIKSIEKNQLVLCFCASISGEANSCFTKINKFTREHINLSPANGDLEYFETQAYILALKAIAKDNDLEVSEQYLRDIISGNVKVLDPSHQILANYYTALKYAKENYSKNINEDFLGEIFAKVNGTEEFYQFYRDVEDKNRENRVIIDRVYTCAPVALIPTMMDSLFNFLAISDLPSTCKASIAYYYISYIRPFNKYSDAIAILIAKSILASSDFGPSALLLPLESIIIEKQEELAKIFVEVQKTNDTTYFVNYMLSFIKNKCDELTDVIINAKATEIKKDFYRLDEPEKTAINIPQEKPEEVKQEVVEEVKEGTKPVEQVKKLVEDNSNLVNNQVIQEQVAVTYIPPALDERQAARLEVHLLEMDPLLKKHEAKFYARHCTLGKRYTIAQYKKSIGCVYETARTSMDHLVTLGYYRKEMVKNKHVYTPIPKQN
jgi:Fic family protein